MLKKLLIVTVVLVVAVFFSYRAYEYSARGKKEREAIRDIFGSYSKHPVFGAITKTPDGWTFEAPLPATGLKVSRVQFTIEGDPGDIHVKNYKLLLGKWPAIWPAMLAALKKEMAEYGDATAVSTTPVKLSVNIPDKDFGDEAEWNVNLEFEPTSGVYYVDMRGWEIAESGADF